jgi:hypothetical protein
MPIDFGRLAAALGLAVLLSGCVAGGKGSLKSIPDNFGEANRQTMMAQVIDPNPEYDTAVPVSSGEHAGQAIERYRKDQVKKPERSKTSNVGQSSGGNGGSGGN